MALRRRRSVFLFRASGEDVPCYYQDSRPVEDLAFKDLSLEKLRTAVCGLTAREQELIVLRFVRELTMEQFGMLLVMPGQWNRYTQNQ